MFPSLSSDRLSFAFFDLIFYSSNVEVQEQFFFGALGEGTYGDYGVWGGFDGCLLLVPR